MHAGLCCLDFDVKPSCLFRSLWWMNWLMCYGAISCIQKTKHSINKYKGGRIWVYLFDHDFWWMKKSPRGSQQSWWALFRFRNYLTVLQTVRWSEFLVQKPRSRKVPMVHPKKLKDLSFHNHKNINPYFNLFNSITHYLQSTFQRPHWQLATKRNTFDIFGDDFIFQPKRR